MEIVNVRKIQTYRGFLGVYLSQTDNNCWEAKSQWIEEVLQKMAILHLILYIRIKGRDIKGVT